MVNFSNLYNSSSIWSVEIEFLMGSQKIPSECFSVWVERGYFKYLISTVLRLLVSGLFHTPYRKSYISSKYYWIISLFVMAIMNSTNSQVFIYLVIRILFFYQLIDFLANCCHLKERIGAALTSTRLLVHVIFPYCSWKWYYISNWSLYLK